MRGHVKDRLRLGLSEGIVDQNYGVVAAVLGKAQREALRTATTHSREFGVTESRIPGGVEDGGTGRWPRPTASGSGGGEQRVDLGAVRLETGCEQRHIRECCGVRSKLGLRKGGDPFPFDRVTRTQNCFLFF
jgi:hypothetical protein